MTTPSPRRERSASSALRAYKLLIAPILHAVSPSRCIYLPTCSEYASLAVARFGLLRGSWLALRRFSRCHPWAAGGFDPIPERDGTTSTPDSVQHNRGH